MENQNLNQPVQEIQNSAAPELTPSDNSDKHKKINSKLLIILGVILVLILGLVVAYLFGKNGPIANNKNAEVSATPAPDPTKNWKTYSNSEEYSIKYPTNWTLQNTNSLVKIFPSEAAQNETSSPYISISVAKLNPINCNDNCSDFSKTEEIKVNRYLATRYIQEDGKLDKKCNCSSEKVVVKNGSTYYLFTLYGQPSTDLSVNPESISNDNAEIFYEILSTLELKNSKTNFVITPEPTIQPAPTKNPIIQEPSGNLENIKFKLPSNWESEISNFVLRLSPNQGGGFLAIKIYGYDSSSEVSEAYCKTVGYCNPSTTITPVNIGNISGFIASGLDNSGGGSEYFGTKDNNLYIITTYTPPSPNEFEDNYQKVLDSLMF